MSKFLKFCPALNEKEICKQLIDYMNGQGLWVWRINAGKVITPTGGMFCGAPAGTSDIIGMVKKEGRFVAIEVKTPRTRTRVTPIQRFFLEDVKMRGGVSGVAWSIESLKDVFKTYGYNFT